MKRKRLIGIVIMCLAMAGVAIAAEQAISLNSPTTFPLDI
ncbi:MAG: hypothetical protein ACI9FJ_003266 [Alteromonadaceae bacterium]|jgi:hypothetical protein